MSRKNDDNWLTHPRTVVTREPHGAAQLVNREDWMSQGSCARALTDSWFLDGRWGEDREQAIRLCRRPCPVREECLSFALRMGPELQGVWGGTTQAERQRMLQGAR